MDWKLGGLILFVPLSGCVTLDHGAAAQRSTADLCKIAVVGTANHGWTTVDNAGRVAAEQEALRRGVNCMDHAANIEANERAHAAGVTEAFNAGARAMSQPQTAPIAPSSVLRTDCRPMSNSLTTCTTYFNDGTSQTVSCRTLSNGTTSCM